MKSAKCILIMIFLIGAISIGSINAYAVEVVGENTGLKVKLSDTLIDTDNLNPGDTKTSTMTIFIDPKNSVQTFSLRVWIRAEIIEYIFGERVSGKKGNLDDKLVLTVTDDNGKKLHDGPISKFNKNVEVGYIQKGTPVDLTFTVHLPGASTGNEYQGATIKVKWIVTAQYRPSDEPTPTPRPPLSRPTPPPKVTVVPTISPGPPQPTISVVPTITGVPTVQPSVTSIIKPYDIKDEEIPGGPGDSEKEDDPEIIIIEEEEIPKGLPKTGELPPILFFSLGAGAIYIGMKLNRKKQK